MTKWLLYLLLAPLMTPQERADTRAYYKAQRKAFCERHLIREMTPEEEQLDRELDERDE